MSYGETKIATILSVRWTEEKLWYLPTWGFVYTGSYLQNVPENMTPRSGECLFSVPTEL